MTAKTAPTHLSGKKAAPVAEKSEDGWPADAVERRLVDSLVPYARNARTHSPEQVAQIAASIREWGWTVPVLIDEASNIIAGHCRVLAAQRLGPVYIHRSHRAMAATVIIARKALAVFS